MADVKFIANTVSEILRDCSPENIKIIIGNANKYATVLKFPKDKSLWSDKQVDRYLTFIEKSSTLPDLSDEEDVVVRIQTIMGEVTDITNGKPEEQKPDGPLSGTVKEVVEKLEERKKYREDLVCPWCNSKVYDNRNNKKSDRSPDFVCSTNDPVVCGGHTGKWRKSWWLNSSDIPEKWNINAEKPL
tara:strand:+ start:12951 stop:13511 length:561 start_codon:yes stop_codon:yes gene_type:complete